MGGAALKNCTTRRYQAEEYHQLEQEVLDIISNNFPFDSVSTIKAYTLKESFGDMDVLACTDKYDPCNIEDKLIRLFNTKEVVKNGNVVSFEYKQFQIDLILTRPADYVSSQQYFAYNDLGNLIGRVAHSMGLKLGHDGLTYKFYADKTQVFREITLLKDWEQILPVLGYSWERYQQGFDTLEDIFKFVVSSPFFNKSIYALENRNHAARTRDAKRLTYTSFLEWLENYNETEVQKFHREWFVKNDCDKIVWTDYLFGMIPNFYPQYEQAEKDLAFHQEFKRRYNGELVAGWTGLQGKELGAFMSYVKQEKTEERLKKDIVTLNPVLVERMVKYYFEKWKETIGGLIGRI
jgi:hypothetical protein